MWPRKAQVVVAKNQAIRARAENRQSKYPISVSNVNQPMTNTSHGTWLSHPKFITVTSGRIRKFHMASPWRHGDPDSFSIPDDT